MWHLSKDGVSRPCEAKYPEDCRLQEGLGHFNTQEEACEFYEESQKGNLVPIIINDVSDAFAENDYSREREGFEDVPIEQINPSNMSYGEKALYGDLSQLEFQIQSHKDAISKGMDSQYVKEMSYTEPYITRRVNNAALESAWRTQDYDAVRKMHLHVYKIFDLDDDDVIRLSDDDLIRITKENFGKN